MKATKPVEPTKHFFEYFNENLPKNWDEPALTDYDDVTSYTYGEMGAKMMQVQAMLEVAVKLRDESLEFRDISLFFSLAKLLNSAETAKCFPLFMWITCG